MSSAPSSHRMALSSLPLVWRSTAMRWARASEERRARVRWTWHLRSRSSARCASSLPELPNANAAGWGYQLLTSVLAEQWKRDVPTACDAYDSGGNVVELGRRARPLRAPTPRPLGRSDHRSPGQGATGVGQPYSTSVALTPGAPFKIPTDGQPSP